MTTIANFPIFTSPSLTLPGGTSTSSSCRPLVTQYLQKAAYHVQRVDARPRLARRQSSRKQSSQQQRQCHNNKQSMCSSSHHSQQCRNSSSNNNRKSSLKDSCQRTPPSRRKIMPKSVRFVLDENQQPVVSLHLFSKHQEDNSPATPSDELFYSRREQKTFLTFNFQQARRVVEQQPEIIDGLYTLHGYVENDTTNNDTDWPPPCQQDNEASARWLLAASECRGLEPLLTSLSHEHRSWAVHKLLQLQWECRHNNHNMSAEQRADMLGVWSARIGAASRRFAHQVALGDAEYVASLYDEMTNSNDNLIESDDSDDDEDESDDSDDDYHHDDDDDSDSDVNHDDDDDE